MKSKILLATVGFVVLSAGCAANRIESNMRKGYAKKVDRLYVILSSSDSSTAKFYDEFKPILSSSLEKRSIDSMIHVYDLLGLDENSTIKSELETFKPNHVLTIVQIGKVTNVYNEVASIDAGASFELTLSEIGSKGAIWKAVLRTSVDAFSSTGVGSADSITDEIIDCLQKDSLIPPGAI